MDRRAVGADALHRQRRDSVPLRLTPAAIHERASARLVTRMQ
jgi:hypothetical protein